MSKIYHPAQIRNLSFIGHIGTGKTLFTEHLLYLAKEIDKKGSIEKGTTASDYTEEEIEHKMSIHSSLSFIEWKENKVNVIDTPGSGDFVGEVRPSFRVAETAVFFVNAEFGIEIETEKKWQRASEYNVSRAIVINKMDKDVNLDNIIANVKGFSKPPAALIQYPIGVGSEFKGVIDVIHRNAYFYDNGKLTVTEIPDEYKEKTEELREELKESICEVDDNLMERFLAGEPFTDEEVTDALIKSILARKVVPVLFASAETGVGAEAFLDAMVSLFPSPLCRPETHGHTPDKDDDIVRHMDEEEPFSAFVFKTTIDQYAGRISYFKVRSGSIGTNGEIYNPRMDKREKVVHVYTLIGKKQIEIDRITAGDIGVAAKLQDTVTNDTLCSPDGPINYPPLRMPQPIYFTAITFEKNEDKAMDALHRIEEENPTFHLEFDPETKETILKAMGEQQVNIALERVKTQAKAVFTRKVPTIAYRETVKGKAVADYRHKKQSGGRGQFGEVHIDIEPKPRDAGFEFVNDIFGGAIPKNFIPGVEKGIQEAMLQGPLAKFPVVDVKVRLFDGKYHDVDSSELAFKIAGSQAMKIAMQNAHPVLLEPIMKVSVFVPEEMTGDIMNDLTSKRGRILGMDKVSEMTQAIRAEVPLAEMMTYSIDLKTVTSGRGTFEMEHSHYQELSGALADKVIQDREAQLSD